jgi:hypothetical protein
MALWRLSVLGPLVSARLEHGDRKALFVEAAEKVYEHPSGRRVRLSPRTIESWFYRWKSGGLEALAPRVRSDRGTPRDLDPELVELVLRAKREKPRRSVRRLIRILERAGRVERGRLSRSTVHRLLVQAGLGGRPARAPSKERRSFMVEHAGDLWLGDSLHGPKVLEGRRYRKTYLLSQMDVATRYMVQSGFCLSEGAVDHERGFKQALLVCGRPRTYYVDLGAAYIAGSLRAICGELAIHLLHTAPRDCEAKGAIERWHRTWREEVGDELVEEGLTLERLNQIHWAWLGREYHERVHTTTGRRPREHFLSEATHLRPLPRAIDLEAVFCHRAKRRVRKDGTVRFGGARLEVLWELVGRDVELRYDPTEAEPRPRVYVDGRFVCDTTPLDLLANATRRRRTPVASAAADIPPTGLDPLEDISRAHYERVPGPGDDDDNEEG